MPGHGRHILFVVRITLYALYYVGPKAVPRSAAVLSDPG